MRILVIHGRNTPGRTARMAGFVLDSLRQRLELSREPVQTEDVFLPRALPDFCTGCEACFRKGESFCPHASFVAPLVERMRSADLLVLLSPCYVLNITAPLKNLYDHLGWMWMSHRPDKAFFGKPVLVVASAAGFGIRSTLSALAASPRWWGSGPVVKFGGATGDFSDPRIEDRLRLEARRVALRIFRLHQRRFPRIGVSTRLRFELMRLVQRGNTWSMLDRRHWASRGWLAGQRPWRTDSVDNDEELWDILDEYRRPTGRTHRRGDPLAPGDRHLVVHVLVTDGTSRLLAQKRSTKKSIWPGVWDLSAGGSAVSGEDSRTAALRELAEELGITVSREDLQSLGTVEFPGGFDDFWMVNCQVDPDTLRFDRREVSAVRWVETAEYRELAERCSAVPYPQLDAFFGAL